MRRLAVVCACILLSGSLLSAQEPTPEQSDDPALAACQAQVEKLATQVLSIRLEYLRKTEEFKAYEAAAKQQQALKPVEKKP